MISAEDARQFAETHFPEAPEALAAELGLSIRESPMDGCDGWCLTLDERSIIRINLNQNPGRKRFTLAHEPGHLILGIPGVVGESYEDMLSSNSSEERRMNDLASELLMPASVVRSLLPDKPVVAGTLQRRAKRANVSELAAAIRVCNLATEIGLINASVVLFDEELVKWQWSKTLRMPEQTAGNLLVAAREVSQPHFAIKEKMGLSSSRPKLKTHNSDRRPCLCRFFHKNLGCRYLKLRDGNSSKRSCFWTKSSFNKKFRDSLVPINRESMESRWRMRFWFLEPEPHQTCWHHHGFAERSRVCGTANQ